ncbi:GntR family transcriptional regulator [Streptomyces sp. NPDC056400]|uniref:GntR family transcriptional regulator n=1 Tax=Streptomyces sp. NPDC056400 TaxID=3345808 RepID=UPI0035DA1AED
MTQPGPRSLPRPQAAATLAVRRHLAAHCPPDQLMLGQPATEKESVNHLASLLSLSHKHVQTALQQLHDRGAVALIPPQGVLVLGPQQPHPADTGIADLIRRRIASGGYRPGQPLALQLLALHFRMSADQVRRACRPLIRAGLLHSRPNGPYGPGIYVRPVPTGLSAATPQAVRGTR